MRKPLTAVAPKVRVCLWLRKKQVTESGVFASLEWVGINHGKSEEKYRDSHGHAEIL